MISVCAWLKIVWLTLWSGRITAHLLSHPVGLISRLFSNNSKKWKDMFRQLEIPATIFLAEAQSFYENPFFYAVGHQKAPGGASQSWVSDKDPALVDMYNTQEIKKKKHKAREGNDVDVAVNEESTRKGQGLRKAGPTVATVRHEKTPKTQPLFNIDDEATWGW
ncbi:MAG: hypothetical protein Q9221_006335 [Calogaya cf. arnoldii]